MAIPEEVIHAIIRGERTASEVARTLGCDYRSLRRRVKATRLRAQGAGFSVAEVPSPHQDITALIEERKRKFRHLKEFKDATRLIPVQVLLDGPIGILHMGDPHVDDDGTDVELLEQHTDLIRNTEGLFGANLGDTTNNWVGRLKKLYAEQSTSESEAWQLAEWFIRRVKWLYFLDGNHGLWSGEADPVKWILGKNTVHGGMAARLELKFPNGRSVRLNVRHDFRGHSQWNTAHGIAKAAQLGWRDHILIAGHKHISGYQILKDPATGTLSHAIQVASYKTFDRYAEQLGLNDQTISPAVVTVIDPEARDEAALVTVFHDVEAGAEFLTWKRQRRQT